MRIVVRAEETRRDVAKRELHFHASRASAYLTLMTAANSEADFDNWKKMTLMHLNEGCPNPFSVPDEPWETGATVAAVDPVVR